MFLVDCSTIIYFVKMGYCFIKVLDSIHQFNKKKLTITTIAIVFLMVLTLFRFKIFEPVLSFMIVFEQSQGDFNKISDLKLPPTRNQLVFEQLLDGVTNRVMKYVGRFTMPLVVLLMYFIIAFFGSKNQSTAEGQDEA